MIVKNEAAKLPRCLASIKGVVDAIAIVDTGSTDSTIEIAKSHGAEVVEIAWPGAFDEARNESLKVVETEWILWLDADEWLATESGPKISHVVQRNDAFCFNLILQEVGPSLDQGQVALPRLWRSRPFVPFVGVVHEHIDSAALRDLGETRREYTTDIVLYHDGYAGGLVEEKYDRYIVLLREELRRRPGQVYYEVKLACTLAAAKSPDAGPALAALADRLVAETDRDDQDGSVSAAFMPLFESISESELRTAKTDALLRAARGWFPDHPAVAWAVAQLEIRRGDLQSALYALLDVEKMAQTGAFDRRTGCPSAILGVNLWTNLALVAHQLGRKEVARRNYERILAADPQNAVARQNLQLL